MNITWNRQGVDGGQWLAIFLRDDQQTIQAGLKGWTWCGSCYIQAVWVHETPMGDFGIVLIEGKNVAEANKGFAESTDPFDVWFKETVLDFSGVDFSHPLPAMSASLYDFRA